MSLIPKPRCLLVTILVSGLATLPLSPSHAGGLTAAHSYQEDSEIGGLGIHLIKKMFDQTEYRRNVDRNVISVVKLFKKS